MAKKSEVLPPPSFLSYESLVTDVIGELGRAQILIAIVHFIPSAFMPLSMITVSFSTGRTNWWKVSHVYNETADETHFVRTLKDCTPLGANDTIVYDSSYTITSENIRPRSKDDDDDDDLEYVPTWIKTAQMTGVLLGAVVNGQLGDWVGRHKCVWAALIMNVLFLLVQAFSVNWIMMLISIFMVGISIGGFIGLNFVYIMEFIGTSHRTWLGLLPGWSIGVMTLGGLRYALSSWRHIIIIAACINAVFVVAMWFTPESIRWLLSHGKIQQATETLNKMAKINRRPPVKLSDVKSIVAKKKNEEKYKALKYNYFTLFKFKTTRWRVPILGIVCFSISYIYYGLTFGVSLLPGSPAANMSLMGLCIAVSPIVALLLTKKVGRRYTAIILFAFLSLSSLVITIGYATNLADATVIKRVSALTSLIFIGGIYPTLDLFSIELFPTVVRSSAYGFISTCSRVGGIIAPQSAPLYEIAKHLPYTVNSVLAVMYVLILFLLEDRSSENLQDQLEEEHELMELNEEVNHKV